MTSRLNRRKLIKGTAGVAGASALASSSFHAPNIIARQAKTPVVFWTQSTAIGLESQQSIVNAFNEQSPDVEVTLEQVPPGDVTDSAKLITAVRGGSGPDCYYMDRFIVPERAANGLLQDLTGLLEQNGVNPDLTETHVEFAAAEATYNGSPYALPFNTGVRALFYNKTLLTEAGVDLERFDPASGPMTWDQLKEAAIATNIDGESGDNFMQMGYVPYFNQAHHYTYGFSWGADFFDEEACEVTPNTPEMIEASQWVYDFCAELDPAKVQAFIQAAVRPGAPPQESPWHQNRLGMVLTGNYTIAQNQEYAPDMDYGITYTPVPEAGMESTSWAGGWSIVIPQGAQQSDAAIKFMLFACGEDGQRMEVQHTGQLPTILTLQEEESLFGERHRFFVEEIVPTTTNRPPLPVGAKYWDELTAAWEKIYLNEEEPQAALETAKENTMTLLGPFCPVS